MKLVPTLLLVLPRCCHGVPRPNYLCQTFLQYTNTAAAQDLYAANLLLNVHAKTGNLPFAHRLFTQMPQKNIVSWTCLISGYARANNLHQSFCLFSQMLAHSRPNDFTYTTLLSVCDYSRGVQVHALAFKTGFTNWVYVVNSLISMYWKNSTDDAGVQAFRLFRALEFPNLVTYNAMIAGFQMHKLVREAMALFIEMRCDGVGFDRATFLSLVSTLCASDKGSDFSLGLQSCVQLHCLGVKAGLTLDVCVVTALVKAYSNLGGEVDDCYKLFLETSLFYRDLVLWTNTITTFADRDPEQALFLFNKLRRGTRQLDSYVLSVVMKASAGLVTERPATMVHSLMIKAGFLNVLVLDNSLIHAYSRCGTIDKAKQVFDEMGLRDIVSWNSMLKAYALHGKAKVALELFRKMDIIPDGTTLVAVLSACSHGGMVKEGTYIFDTMYEKYGIVPQLDHYACMVDILGRAGHLLEAKMIIGKMPMKPDYVVWSAFLGACRKHNEAELANLASLKLKELDPQNSLGYVLMSNLYCSTGCFGEANIVRKEMNQQRIQKEPGLSWSEVDGRVHEFASGGWRHPCREEILLNLEELLRQLRNMGYAPETSLAMHDVEEEHKEEQLYLHSEKLALVYSLMNAKDCNSTTKSVIRIMKNIRICLDCHNFMKLASKLVEREIIVRDANRFHHFSEGVCSCNDYW